MSRNERKYFNTTAKMNKSESKYFNTAVKMDKALLEILEKKEFAFITVKEICEKAGVNRSTFYLHYETIGDLLSESVEHINNQFLEYMKIDVGTFANKIKECPLEEMYLVTPRYLEPYLKYIRNNRNLFKTVLENSGTLCLKDSYAGMFEHIFTPILESFRVPENNRKYMIKFYIRGLMGIVDEWLKEDCEESIENIMKIMQQCVNRP